MGKSDGKCHFCKVEIEYLTHLFYECRVIKDVLKNLETKINQTLQSNGYEQQLLDLQLILLGDIIKYENIRYTSGSITKTVLHKIKSCCKFWAKTNV